MRGMYNFLCVVLVLSTTTVAFQEIPNVSDINDNDTDCPEVLRSNLIYTLFNKQNSINGIVLNNETYHNVDPVKRTVVIIHGWLQNSQKPWVLLMKDTYLDKTDANIVVLDWSTYSGINYLEDVCFVPAVGNFTGDLLVDVSESVGLDLSTVQINGFSLGAHVAGFAGQRVQELTGGDKIGRINGLEAAKQGFEGYSEDRRLDSSDAVFVQAIHTDRSLYGYSEPYGTVDFEVNASFLMGCGSIQNGCPLEPGVPTDGSALPYIFCNHLRAVAYFIESINTDQFLAVSCASCFRFNVGQCKNETSVVMGENCSPNASGTKYLRTNSKPPFAKGQDGVY